MATVHMSAPLPNLYLMESVRSFARGFFADLVDAPPVVQDGSIEVPEHPGLGLPLRPEVVAAAIRVRSERGVTVVAGWTSGDPWAGQVGDRV